MNKDKLSKIAEELMEKKKKTPKVKDKLDEVKMMYMKKKGKK